MKYKGIVRLLIILTVFLLSGCIRMEGAYEMLSEVASDESSALDGNSPDLAEGTAADETAVQTDTAASVRPVMGDGNADFEGFAYLYADEISAEAGNEETEAMANESLVVYVPRSGHNESEGSYITADALGADFRISLNGIELPYDLHEKTTKENLEYVLKSLETTVIYNDTYGNLEVSKVESLGEYACRATAFYVEYDESYDVNNVRYNTYFLKKLSESNIVLVQISVRSEAATEQTESLIQELESFYGFDIEWNADAASQKLDDSESEPEANMVFEWELVFELPAGWRKDDSLGSDNEAVYVNSQSQWYSSMIYMEKYYSQDVQVLGEFTSEEMELALLSAFEIQRKGDYDNLQVSFIYDSVFHSAVKLSATTLYEGNEEEVVTMYAIFEGQYMYLIKGVDYEGTAGAEAVRQIFISARFED